jgi:plastocyanin
MKRAGNLLVTAAVLLAGGCGGGADGGGGSCTPTGSATLTLSASGVTPKAVCVLPGGSVTFVNDDTVAHTIAGDGACAALDVGPIASMGSEAATFPTEQVCQFHESAQPTNTAFQGTVAVTTAPATGPGY